MSDSINGSDRAIRRLEYSRSTVLEYWCIRRLPMDEVAATAVAIFPSLRILMKPSKLTQATPEDTESYVRAKERVRKMI